jgi:DNA-binding CsgD family transcriptional regulator
MRRYSRTALAIGVAVVLPLFVVLVLLPPAAGISTYVAASAAIALVAATLGLAAGIVAVLAASGTALLIELPPVGEFHAEHPQDVFALALFAIDGLVVAVIGSLLHRYRSKLRSTPWRAAPADGAPAPALELHRDHGDPAHHPLSLRLEPLTDREAEVLTLLATGKSNAEIGDTLCISTNTVKSHLKNVYGKLEVESRTGALSRAFELGIVPSPRRRSDHAAAQAGAPHDEDLEEELAA